ncbi:ABC transporter ATP-binding protein [Thiomicrospira sp. WB1]|uniref:ABC transporter ATP-binding protein n=1 Tax=Thiomicrospira sp. WB1 TaxID=1685380 RepID=UPI000746B496|nr:ATP-binding cassette domain-containing protein [Thiomicrospira sp. WB1]KUJ72010.1 lipoprotein ABC transporter ATP-binding protein [Thiomicrospira sp. WB1]
MSDCILKARGLSKTYQDGDQVTQVLQPVDFYLKSREKVAIVGASGSGKSTLLHLLAGLDAPSEGEIVLMNQPFSAQREAKRGRLRNQYMGFVYQFHFLLPELTALENVMLPLRIRRTKLTESRDKALALLDQVGLSHRREHKPSELSGGERQRVAIARALITEPACILADEPTGNLDDRSAAQIFDLMLALNDSHQTALVTVTHDLTLAARMDRVYRLHDGHMTLSDTH